MSGAWFTDDVEPFGVWWIKTQQSINIGTTRVHGVVKVKVKPALPLDKDATEHGESSAAAATA